MQTNDKPITELMSAINEGKTQIPDFQRGWVGEENRIQALIASITSNFPVGAAMFLEYGNENVRFKYRVIEGAPSNGHSPSELILDGQQRLTSIYSALFNSAPVHTRTDKGKEIYDILRQHLRGLTIELLLIEVTILLQQMYLQILEINMV